MQRLAALQARDVVGDDLRDPAQRARRRAPQVWQADHARMREQRLARIPRLVPVHVETHPPQPTRGERGFARPAIDDLPPRAGYEERAPLPPGAPTHLEHAARAVAAAA